MERRCREEGQEDHRPDFPDLPVEPRGSCLWLKQSSLEFGFPMALLGLGKADRVDPCPSSCCLSPHSPASLDIMQSDSQEQSSAPVPGSPRATRVPSSALSHATSSLSLCPRPPTTSVFLKQVILRRLKKKVEIDYRSPGCVIQS